MTSKPLKLGLEITTVTLITCYIYIQTNLYTAIATFITLEIIIHFFSTPSKIYKNLRLLRNPPAMGILTFLTSKIYFALKGYTATQSTIIAFGTSILGMALAIFLLRLWTV